MFVCNLLGAWFLRIDVVHQTLMNESIAFHKPTSHKMKGHSVSQTKLLSQSLLAVELDTSRHCVEGGVTYRPQGASHLGMPELVMTASM